MPVIRVGPAVFNRFTDTQWVPTPDPPLAPWGSVFRSGLMALLSYSVDSDQPALPCLCLCYALLTTKAIDQDILRRGGILPPAQNSASPDDATAAMEFVAAVMDVLLAACAPESKVRVCTANLAILVLRRVIFAQRLRTVQPPPQTFFGVDIGKNALSPSDSISVSGLRALSGDGGLEATSPRKKQLGLGLGLPAPALWTPSSPVRKVHEVQFSPNRQQQQQQQHPNRQLTPLPLPFRCSNPSCQYGCFFILKLIIRMYN